MLIGLVGKPSTGKSTFFRASTLAEAEIASYPFTTIKPNHAIAYVKIKDLAVEFGKHSNPREGFVKGDWRFVPFELMDVAGLVEGASEGKGLGNQFLDDLAGADAFIMVVDMSGETDSEGKQTQGYYPGNDIKFIENELDLWYLGIFKKVWEVFVRNMKMQKTQFEKAIAKQFSGLKVTEEDVKAIVLREKINVDNLSVWTSADLLKFSRALRKATKPMIIAANKMDRPESKGNLERVKKEFDYPIVPCFADGELSLRQADKAGLINYISGEKDFEIKKDISVQQKEALQKIQNVIGTYGSTGVQEVLNKAVFELLGYIAVYPAGAKLADSKGNILPDCYLMPPNSTALDFAFRLHSDIGKNFVKAVDIRTKKGVGKDYILKNGDGLEIMTR